MEAAGYTIAILIFAVLMHAFLDWLNNLTRKWFGLEKPSLVLGDTIWYYHLGTFRESTISSFNEHSISLSNGYTVGIEEGVDFYRVKPIEGDFV